jgi:hypothetical protein
MFSRSLQGSIHGGPGKRYGTQANQRNERDINANKAHFKKRLTMQIRLCVFLDVLPDITEGGHHIAA